MSPFLIILLIVLPILAIIALYIFLTLPRVFDSANMDLLKIDYAHRGLHNSDAPENSLSAYSRAIEQGFGIEIDVQLSSDGKIFVFHDENLKRMCGCEKKLSELTSDELKAFKLAGTNESIPTLDEVLELVDARVPLLIEIKYYSRTKELCELLATRLDSYIGSFAVQSFDPRVLRYFKKKRPKFARGQLVGKMKIKKGDNPFIAFLLRHLLLNFLSRPDFISIQSNHTRELGFILGTEVFRAKAFIWTVRSKKQQLFFHRQRYYTIFEGFEPN